MSDVPAPMPPVGDDDTAAYDDAVIGRAFRWSAAAILVVGATIVGVVLLNRDRPEPAPVIDRTVEAPPPLAAGPAEMPVVRFTDVTAAAGMRFVHENGARGEKLLPETMGGGCAFLDYDGDGDQDVLLVNGRDWPEVGAGRRDPTLALYRNDGRGGFEDATAEAGLDISLYGMGCAVGDFDGDGDDDLFVTAVGPNHLLRNEGGRFVDVTASAGVAGGDADWSTSAGFLDYDRDGNLDLFVCNYVEWSRAIDIELNFTLNGRDRAYGPPKNYRGTDCALYRGRGDGTFEDVSEAAGIKVRNPATGAPMGKALAVVFHDFAGDGWLDIVVANDTVQNFLFRNQRNGTFVEVGADAGLAFDSMGAATGAMGIDAATYADDGAIGVGIGNFANEASSFFVQAASRPYDFVDRAGAEGIGSPSRLRLSFGLFFFDYDLDGRLDLLQANGHLEEEINQIQPSQHYEQPTQLFWNCGPGGRSCFAVVPEETAGDLARPIVGRAAAYADIDGDGDLDVLLTQVARPPLLLRNDQALGHHWLRVRLVGTGGNTDAIGAVATLRADGREQRRLVMPTRSYLAQVERTLTFGLGASERVESLRIRWPDGAEQEVPVEGVDRELVIRRPADVALRR